MALFFLFFLVLPFSLRVVGLHGAFGLQLMKYTAASRVVSCRGLPPAAPTTKSCGYLPSNDTKAISLPSGPHFTLPQGVLRKVTCRWLPPSRSMTQTFGAPPLTATRRSVCRPAR